MKNMKFYASTMVLMMLVLSCSKNEFEDCNYDLEKAKLDEEISSIVIEDGNGDVFIRKGDTYSFEYPGGWIEDEGHNQFRVENGVLYIGSSFSESFVTMPDLLAVDILSDNSTVIIGQSHATGNKQFAIHENATIRFGEVCGDEEVLAKSTPELHVDVTIHSNGNVNMYDIDVRSLSFNYWGGNILRVKASSELTGTIYDNGKVYYRESPVLNVDIQTDGELINDN
jgi:hypothetical protein